MKKSFILLGMLGLLAGCGGSQDVDVQIELPAAFVSQGSVSHITIQVTATDITTPITTTLTPPFTTSLDGNTVNFTLTLPIGTGRNINIYAPLTGTGPAMMTGHVSTAITESTTSIPAIPMNFINFAIDATGTGDLRPPSSGPPAADLVSFKIMPLTVADAICGANSVEMVIDFQEPYTVPPSIDSQRVVVEFDVDENRLTGSPSGQSFIERTLSPLGGTVRSANGLTNALMTDGTEYLISIVNRTLPSAGLFSVSSVDGSLTFLSNASIVSAYDQTLVTLTVCIDAADFRTIDPDGVGVLNVLSGIDPTSTGPTPGTSYNGNDILYRSGVVHYDLNLDLSTIPGGP